MTRPPAPHTRDAHCEDAEALDDDDNCTKCGATSDGGECGECGGTRYHEPTCPGKGRICDDSQDSGPKTERSMESWLEDAILEAAGADGVDATGVTFEEAGMMTRDRGLVVRFGSTEFQITIVRSAR